VSDRVRVYLLPVPLPRDEAAALERVLTPDELEQLDAYVTERGRVNFTARRGLLRVLLGREIGVPPEAVSLERDRWGKPRLRDDARLRFNVSDTSGLVAVAVADDREVGVDVEWLKPRRFDGLARTTFTRRELAEFRSVPAARRPFAFYEQWTGKEAYSKAVGLGLRVPFTSTEVGPFGDSPTRLPCGRSWTGVRLDVGDGHRGALVVEGGGWLPEVTAVRSLAELA
jgi:4'-phosphopantetheinyl transferase